MPASCARGNRVERSVRLQPLRVRVFERAHPRGNRVERSVRLQRGQEVVSATGARYVAIGSNARSDCNESSTSPFLRKTCGGNRVERSVRLQHARDREPARAAFEWQSGRTLGQTATSPRRTRCGHGQPVAIGSNARSDCNLAGGERMSLCLSAVAIGSNARSDCNRMGSGYTTRYHVPWQSGRTLGQTATSFCGAARGSAPSGNRVERSVRLQPPCTRPAGPWAFTWQSGRTLGQTATAPWCARQAPARPVAIGSNARSDCNERRMVPPVTQGGEWQSGRTLGQTATVRAPFLSIAGSRVAIGSNARSDCNQAPSGGGLCTGVCGNRVERSVRLQRSLRSPASAAMFEWQSGRTLGQTATRRARPHLIR